MTFTTAKSLFQSHTPSHGKSWELVIGLIIELDGNKPELQKSNTHTSKMRENIMSYDPENIFAKILRNEIPANRVYEDTDTVAFMDIMPRANGHALVIPKTPCRNVLDATADQLAAVMKTAQLLSKAAIVAFDADGVTLQQFNEEAGGQEVFHLHFHVLPRHAGVPLGAPGQMGDQDVISKNAEKIRTAISGF